MFRIYDGRNEFYQWDSGIRLVVNDASVREVHFSNNTDETAIVCEVFVEDGKHLVNVPNILLQSEWDIIAYAFLNDYTKVEHRFKVIRRTKPADYVYTETEIKKWDDIVARVDAIEEKGVSQEAINEAVETYLNENPIETGATPEEAAQIQKNTENIADLYDLNTYVRENYTTKVYVDNKVSEIELTAGEDGGYYQPTVDASGNLSWEASKEGMAAVATTNIKGKDGSDGKDGYTPIKGVDYFDGKDGAAGADGGYYTPTISGTTITWSASNSTMPAVSSSQIFADDGAVILTSENYETYITNGDEVSY